MVQANADQGFTGFHRVITGLASILKPLRLFDDRGGGVRHRRLLACAGTPIFHGGAVE